MEYEEATTSNKEDNLQMRDKQQNSNNSNDNKLSKLIENLQQKYYELKIFF